jgi:hypothetical protein
MRVLSRRPRRRSVPGRTPIAPPSVAVRRVVAGAAVEGALKPGDPSADAAVREALVASALADRAAERLDARSLDARSQNTSRRTGSSSRRARGVEPALDPAAMRRWWRYRRRRVLTVLVALVLGQALGVTVVGPGFWTGLGVSAIMMSSYVLHLRGVAAAERRRRERAALRRRRARILAREAALAAGVAAEVESLVASWLATPRHARRRAPSEEIVTVLAAGGQEVVQAEDGTWYPRAIPLPTYVTAPRAPSLAPSRPAAAAAARRTVPAARGLVRPAEPEEQLPRAVNY